MKKIIIATHNLGKLKEIRNILKGDEYEFFSLGDIDFTHEIIEDQDTFEGNALKKAYSVMRIAKELTLADDSGLEVDILNGQPGIFSARFSGEHATDDNNNEKLLRLMKDVPFEERGAQFRCVIALVLPSGQSLISEGICRGKIADKPYGNHGFGYDPIFVPEGFDRTFAQIDEKEKNKISHRSIALHRLKEIMTEEGLLD